MRVSGIRATTLVVALAFAASAQAGETNEPKAEERPSVSMYLTRFDVNDHDVQLSWKIRNDSDHDIWVCDSMSWREGSSTSIFWTPMPGHS